KEEYVQNKEIESYQKKLYEASKDNYLAAFQALPGEFKEAFEGEMGNTKDYHSNSRYSFSARSFNGLSGDTKKIGKSMYDGVNIDDTVFAGSRELKGSVSVKGIPVEVSYGMQYLIVTSGFDISNLGYNFKLKGLGTNYVDNQLSGANQRYEIYKEDIQDRIERQAKSNDAEKESKGFIFTILNGMNGGSGSMGQRFTQAVRSEAQSRITGAVAEATGLPASLVGALVGGSSMKDAVKAYVKDETTNAISKATGLPTWLISNQMEKMNKPKEQWYQSQEFQMVTTVAAVVAAPLTGGASLMIAMAVNAGLGAATGAASGGLKGALVGAVGGAAGAAVRSFTGGAVTVGLSYSAENGFGASVGVGYGPANVTVGISEKGGTTVDLGFNKGGFNAGLSYNSKTGKASGSVGLEISQGSSLGISYNEGDGFGASISKSLDNGINGSLSWSEKGGVGGNIGYEVPGDKNKSKDSLANKMQGSGGSLNWSQRDGVSVAVNASGGVNAGNWSQSGGFQANTNFLNDQWKANFISGKAKEDADAQEASRAAQNKNNAEQGAQAIEGMGVSGRKPEDGGDLSNGTHKPNGEPADPVDQRIAQLRKELSEGISLAHDNGTMSDAGNPALASAAKEISSKMNELKQLEGQKAASQKPGVQKDGSIVVVGSKTPTLSERAASLFGSVASGAKGLWDRATGGNQANIDPHQVVRIGENGLAEYANGARTSIAFNEKTDGPFSQPRTNTIHGAVDLMTPIGTKVSALEDGVVTIARNKPDDYLRYPVEPGKNTKLGGASVSIRHTNANGETVYTYYAHNSEVLVRDGQKVFKGQVIALSGQSGNTPGGPHIHQEVNKYVDGERVQIDPLEFSWEKFNANKN
ncbi:peptidoglycan DD-metalloendopeptidase family protein, partial [Leptospira interrogans]